MTKHIECPPESVLKELIDGKVDEPQLSELSEHVEDCGTCQERARTLSPNDTLVQSLRTDPEPAKKIADGIPRPLIEKVKDIARGENKPGADTLAVSSEDSPPSAKPPETNIDFLAPPQRPDEIGRLGTYRILKVLGKGGMGVVFLADDPELDRLVAVKAMLPNIAANPSAKQRFLREARAAAKLRSDHIVTIHQVSEDRGVPFLAMELLEGVSLDGVLQSGQKVSLAQIIAIGQDVARGLAAAHEKGLIHRDIKPANLWLDQAHAGRVKILDFGLARAEQDDIHLTQSGTIVGTPAYMAPEQARSEKPVDARADLFSLGCVLYRLCAGDIPFKAETTMGVLLAIAMNDAVPPVKVNDQIPPALSELIMQLLEKDPAQRPVSARDVIARLHEIEKSVAALRLDVEKVHAPSDTTNVDWNLASAPAAHAPGLISALEQAKAEARALPAPSVPPRNRRPIVVALAALLFAGLIALAGTVYYWQTNNGIVRIEINDPDIKVAFDKDGPTVTGADKKDIKLRAGEHGLHIQRGDLEFNTDKFILKRGEMITLKIEWFKEGKVQVAQGDKVIGEKAVTAKGTPIVPAPPVSRYALRFGTDGDRVEIQSPVIYDGPLTIETYATITAPTTGFGGWVIAAGLAKSGMLPPGSTLLRVTADQRWNAGLGGDAQKGIKGIEPDAHMEAGRRAHVACVRTAKELRLYIDGKLTGKEPITVNQPKGGVLLGSGTFVGTLDGVRVSRVARYDKDFTPAQRFEPDKDTLALYHFDDGAGDKLTDSSGNNHHGKIFGAKWVKVDAPPPPTGYALAFDGKAHVVLTSLLVESAPAYTLEAYVTATAFPKSSGSYAWPILSSDFASLSLQMPPESKWYATVTRVVARHAAYSKELAVLNKKTHLASVVSDGHWRFFVDGKLIHTAVLQGSGSFGVNRKPFHIGTDDLRDSFHGIIQEVRFSKVARYDKDFTPQERFAADKDTLALYHMNENSGDVLKDSSGNGHHGKIVGARWVKAVGTPPRLLATLKGAFVKGIAFTPDGASVIANGSFDGKSNLAFFDARSGAVQFKENTMAERLSLAVDGKSLAYTCLLDKGLPFTRFMELPSRKITGEFRSMEFPLPLALSPDGKTLAFPDYSNLKFWDVAAGKSEVAVKQSAGNRMEPLKYSPDGRFLATVTYRSLPGKVADRKLVVLDAKTRNPVLTRDMEITSKYLPWADLSPDSQWLLLPGKEADQPAWRLLKLPTGEVAHVESDLPAECSAGAFAPVGTTLALGLVDGTVQIWDYQAKKALRSWSAAKNKQVSTMAFSPDGKTLATAVNGGDIHVWDLTQAATAAADEK